MVSKYCELAKEIFNAKESQLILVVDGTYCYCQKSSNNYFQRKTFSVQKKKHIWLNHFLFSTSNGKIVDVFGLHEATKNDTSIMNDVLLGDENLRKVLHPGDIILLDGGFRVRLFTEAKVEFSIKKKVFETLFLFR